jgi:hypothetical protein
MTRTDKQVHTPGPWHVQRLQVDPHGIIRIGGFEVVTEAYDVVGGNPGVAPIRKQEDAYLIAAAPDLLEALEMAQRAHDYRAAHDYCPVCEDVFSRHEPPKHQPDCRLAQAIAKAGAP